MSLFESQLGFVKEFEQLSKLIQDEEVDDGPIPDVSKPSANPGAIGPKDLLNVKVPAPKPRHDPKEIWQEDEIMDAVEDEFDDGREVPAYEFMYKQAVGTGDVYLGMSGKDESSTCCEDMLVRIELPEASGAEEFDLDVKPTYLKLNSSRYKLSVYLPHKVDDEKGKAKWDAAKKVLTVTLPILREDPF